MMAARSDNPYWTRCDEQMLRLGQAGDRRALARIFTQYRPLAARMARRYFGHGLDREDLIQEGLIGLYQAIRLFRAERLVPFERLASVLIRRRMLSAVRAANRDKGRPLAQYLSYEEERLEAPINQLGRVEAEAGMERALSRLSPVLSPFELRVLALLLADWSPQELSTQLACSPKAVENALARIRDKARVIGASQLLSG